MDYSLRVMLVFVMLSVYPAIAVSHAFTDSRETKCHDNEQDIACAQRKDPNHDPDAHSPSHHFATRLGDNSAILSADSAYPDDGGPATMNTSGEMAQEEILFLSSRDGNYEVYKVDSDGANLTRLTNTDADEFDARWSPDGQTILYERNGQLWLMDNDGANQRYLLNGRHGAFSPDGTKIAYSAYSGLIDGGYNLYVYNLTTKKSTEIYASVGNNEHPDWSPDGQKIVFRNNFFMNGGSQKYIVKVNADGTDAVTLTHVNSDTNQYAWANSPEWSPDGTQILYHYYDKSIFPDYEIYVMNADGTGQKRLTFDSNNTMANCWAVWSPSGEMIAFRSGSPGGIYIMNSDGTQKKMFMNTGYSYPSDWRISQTDQEVVIMPGVMMLLLNHR